MLRSAINFVLRYSHLFSYNL